jgi:radical SAM protein with 4Fe4S-binding SPASM domain
MSIYPLFKEPIRTQVFLKVTESCNLACKCCYVDSTIHKKMPYELPVNFLKQFPKLDIQFHGGEPLYFGADYIIDFIRYLKKELVGQDVIFDITSNLVRPKEELIKLLESGELNQLKTSWNYGDERFAVKEQQHIWDENVKLAGTINPKYKPYVLITMNGDMVRSSDKEIINMINYFNDLDIKTLCLELLCDTPNTFKNEVRTYTSEIISDFLSRWYFIEKEIKPSYNNLLFDTIKDELIYKQGHKVFNKDNDDCIWWINPDGGIGGCPIEDRKVFSIIDNNNPDTYSIEKLKFHKIMEVACQMNMMEECKNCEYLAQCGRGCRIRNERAGFECRYPKYLIGTIKQDLISQGIL